MRKSTACPTLTRDVLLGDVGGHLKRPRVADPEEDLADIGDLADLAILPQHDAGARGEDLVVAEPLRRGGDEGADLREIGDGLVIGLLGGDAALQELAHPVDLALGERLAGLLLGEIGAHLAVVEAGEHVALLHRAALAGAMLDDALPRHGGHLGPAHRLDHAGRIDDLGRRAAADRLQLHLRPAAVAPPQRAARGSENRQRE